MSSSIVSNLLLGNLVWDPLLNETVGNNDQTNVNDPIYINFFDNGIYNGDLNINGSVNITLDTSISGDLTTTDIYSNTIIANGSITGTCFSSISDRNLKENIHKLAENVILDDIHLYSYNYKSNPLLFYGVMAQDLIKNKLFSHLVSYNKKNEHYTVDYTQFIPVLIKENQSLKKRIKNIEKFVFAASILSVVTFTALSLKR
jgi:hypothetical protein